MSAIKMSVGGTGEVKQADPRVAMFTALVDRLIAVDTRDDFTQERDAVIRAYRDAIEYMDDV